MLCTATLALIHFMAEYCAHTHLINKTINNALHVMTKCQHSTSTDNLFILASMQPLCNGVSSMVKLLKCCAYDQHGLGLKPICVILLCPWERHFMALSPTWWSWQAVLNYSHICIKLKVDSNILASSEAGLGNCLSYESVPLLLSCKSGG